MNRTLALLLVAGSAVTLAAQILTFPLSLYYFGQFPSYFLISNMVVVPVFSLLLILLVALIPLTILPSFAMLLGTLIHLLIGFSSDFLKWTDSWPNSLLNGLYLSLAAALLIYAFIMTTSRWLMFKNKHMLLASLLILLVLSGMFAIRNLAIQNQTFISVHSIRGHDVFTCVQGRMAYVVSDSAFFRKKGRERLLSAFLYKNGISEVKEVADHNSFVSTNFKHIPKLGFQFFDRIMTIKKTVHLSVHPKVFLRISGKPETIRKHLNSACNNLILSNKINKTQREEILYLISQNQSFKEKMSVGFRIIPVSRS